MPRLGLALSGGGFRATLYHLGILRFLKDAGQLQHVTDIASVSGGSILAAHLVLNWDCYTGDDERFDEAVAEVVRFVQFDVRNHIVRRMPLQYPLRMLAKLTRRPIRNLTPNAILEHYYKERLYGDRCLYELPEQPSLHILATRVSNGKLSVFNRSGLYVQQRTNGGEVRFEHIPAKIASISRIVGASSAFPGFFPPVEVTAADLGVREGEFSTEYFTDGGVFDNLGIRAFHWLDRLGENFDEVIVSDAGKPFQILTDNSLGFIGQSVRASDILWDRVWQLERENFGRQAGYLFMPITESVAEDEQPTLHPVIQAEVQTIRTDLDCFSDEEVNGLAQHGYEVARKVYRQQHGDDDVENSNGDVWAPVAEHTLPTVDAKRAAGHAAASAPTAIARRLRGSAVRRVWSTLFDFRDWPTYLYVALALFLLGYLPLQVYQLYDRAQMLTEINEAISQGDPDIRRVLQLVHEDPTEGWMADEVIEVPEAVPIDKDHIELMTHSRIIDLRHWHPNETVKARRGKLYVSDRIELKLLESYPKGEDRRVTLTFPLTVADMEFRQPSRDFQATIKKVVKPIEILGQMRTVYLFEWDLDGVALGEPVPLEVDMLVDIPKEQSRARFVTTKLKTDLMSMWLLFPEDRPYRTYNLVQYPTDGASAPEVLDSRYKIDHPYGSLIGWSVVNPKEETTYECRWTYK